MVAITMWLHMSEWHLSLPVQCQRSYYVVIVTVIHTPWNPLAMWLVHFLTQLCMRNYDRLSQFYYTYFEQATQ